MNKYVKAIESWLRHFKIGAVVGVLSPLVLQSVHILQKSNYQFGVNLGTLYIFLLAVAGATLIVGYRYFIKKDPALRPEIQAVTEKILEQLGNIATTLSGTANSKPIVSIVSQLAGDLSQQSEAPPPPAQPS